MTRSNHAAATSFVLFGHNVSLGIISTLLHWNHLYLLTTSVITAFPLGHLTGVVFGISLRYVTKRKD